MIEYIKQALSLPLPGRLAQFEMTNITRDIDYVVPDNARLAGVMLLIFPLADQFHVLFIQRTAQNPNDPHSGQVSFPGGKFEQSDASLLHCALRETYEEVGVNSDSIQVLGALTPLYIPISNFDVHPFVGYTPQKPDFFLQESEVKSIITHPVEHFLSEHNKDNQDITVRDFTMRNVPYFKSDDRKIWGATAMILNEFLTVWKNAQQPL
jgi:8-oxo-dGTP pyrophosphatase MutT (NUDIX family)